MGVYIPNIEKPKICMDNGNCLSCPMSRTWCGMLFAPKGYTSGQTFADMDGKVPKWCPMIEIDLVRCGECKWWNEETHGCNRNPSVNAWLETDFCSYGERK